ncbi:LysE family transporter [Paractinoplanes toevensis]|uniref:Lysine transporter LysE n=1 Tax=Paractinoplanes toevensis TaxID=571911 RepID=A0A919WB23_9ACTN|nr:LysE family transporter [Actinoplanes toevensis]GIM96888.1 lysine transporter LysE [Actinoplanes toevensis]
MSAPFLAGVIAGYGVAVPVGAIGVLIAGLSARTSLRVGAAAGLGAATADGIYALIAVLGGAAAASLIAPIATPLRWLAAAILLILAVLTARAAFRKPGAARPEKPTTATRAYTGILALTLLNPATVVYFAALVLGGSGEGGGVWFVAGAFLASASWQLLLAGGGSLIGRLLTGDRGRMITALVSSTVIAILAITLLTGA